MFGIKTTIKFFFPKSIIKILNQKVLKENINEIVHSNKINETIDFFSLDIDGNDYWVLKELDTTNINVICCEYNNYLGNNVKKTIPYNPEHNWKNNGCFGASLHAIFQILSDKGFSLIAVESSGTNAFFVKNKFAINFEVLSPSKSWKAVDRHNTHQQIEFIKDSIKRFNFIEL